MSPIVVEEPRGRTTYIDQVMVATSNNGKTVTGRVVLTRGIWHGMAPFVCDDGSLTSTDWPFCVESHRAPRGLPLIDQSKPFGSPFQLCPT